MVIQVLATTQKAFGAVEFSRIPTLGGNLLMAHGNPVPITIPILGDNNQVMLGQMVDFRLDYVLIEGWKRNCLMQKYDAQPNGFDLVAAKLMVSPYLSSHRSSLPVSLA
jgi:hypothetical protein